MHWSPLEAPEPETGSLTRPGATGAHRGGRAVAGGGFLAPWEAVKWVRAGHLHTPVRRAIIGFIAQLLPAEIAPLVTAPETVYDHRG